MVSGSSNFRHPIINTFLWLFGDSSTSKNTKQIKGNNIGGSSSSAGDSSGSVGGNNINPDKIAISCGKVSWRDSKDGDNLAIIYGNENTNGTFIYTGMKPSFVILKKQGKLFL